MLFCSHSKVLEALTFCSEIRNCERFVPILQGLTIGDVQMRVCLRVVISYTHTHPFNGPFSGTTQVSQYWKGKTNLDFTEARDSEWQWHQLGHMQVCTSLQTDNDCQHPTTQFSQAGCPSCRPTNSVKALKAHRAL